MAVLHCLSVSTIPPLSRPSNICIGLTVALQLKVTIEPTQTYWSPVTLTISGGSVE